MNNQPTTNDQHKQFLTAVIQKYYIVFGPDITRATVSKVSGIDISAVGEVKSFQGDPQKQVHSVIKEFSNLSQAVVHLTVQDILERFAGYKITLGGEQLTSATQI